MAELIFRHLAGEDYDMENLNELELSILNELSFKHPSITCHIPFLRVLNREITGVGMYVNLCYLETTKNIPSIDISVCAISTNESIKVPNLKYGLAYEVNITDDRIDFIEFVTYGNEVWDGNTDGLSLSRKN